MANPVTDEQFAIAFAPLLEVKQNGVIRPATPNDVLELVDGNGGRYLLKGAEGYLAKQGAGWTTRQRDAIVIPDRAFAHEARREGLEKNGIRTKVIRLRRPGTCGIESVRMRAGVEVSEKDGLLGIGVSEAEGMALLAALAGAKAEGGEQ